MGLLRGIKEIMNVEGLVWGWHTVGAPDPCCN